MPASCEACSCFLPQASGFRAASSWPQDRAVLPAPATLYGLSAVALLLALWASTRLARAASDSALCVSVALAAFVWASATGHAALADRLPQSLEGQDIDVTGVIAGLPQRVERGRRFDLAVEQAPPGVPRRIALTWYDSRHADASRSEATPQLRAGSRWQLRVRLKRPHGNMNPHGFDYEAWLFERGIGATGHVRAGGEGRQAQRLIDGQAGGLSTRIDALRDAVRSRFTAVMHDDAQAEVQTWQWAGVLIALAIGDQRAIAPAHWDLFERAGLTHLVSISGLHVTMVAALSGLLLSVLWRRVPALALRCAAQRAGIVAGLIAATAYCALAGFGIPAQRTLIMLAVAGVAVLAGRFSSPFNALALAVCVVLPLHPMAVMNPGFWLSFGAVALLFYAAAGHLGPPHPVRSWLGAQAAITLGLAPPMMALFGQVSLVSPLINLFAIPLVSVVITPLVLIAIVLPFDALLWLAHALTTGLMWAVQGLVAPDWVLWHAAAPAGWAVACGMLGAVNLLAPRGWPARALAVPLMLPLFMTPDTRPAAGDMRVGYGAEADAGGRLVLPYLRSIGVRRLDTLVVSHADSDHSGGAASLLAGLPVGEVLSSVPAHDGLRLARRDTRDCAAGQRWTVDGVRFAMLHPPPGAVAFGARSSNALSCVLRIDSAHGSAMITGDVLADGEAALIEAAAPLAADLLVSPHHGSRTSSTEAFVEAVDASDVVHAVGYRNRFNHPHPKVQQRYADQGTLQWRSDAHGAVAFDFTAGGIERRVSREIDARYWHNRVFGQPAVVR
ncbi:MAG: competence protein ComEC [Methyloversatilis sp. 12-65-5]|nr:MAG: competence protein ComEC [Methyloversatilis sp. 12-65-5]